MRSRGHVTAVPRDMAECSGDVPQNTHTHAHTHQSRRVALKTDKIASVAFTSCATEVVFCCVCLSAFFSH